MDQIFILVLFVLMVAAVAYVFNRRTDDVIPPSDETLDDPIPATPPVESTPPVVQDQKVRKAPPTKSAKKPSKKATKKPVKKPRNRREL